MDAHLRPERRFDAAASAYSRGRPGYPPELAEWVRSELGLTPGERALEIGAGTGELTDVLRAADLEVVAVEPSAGMRGVLAERFPGLEIRDETAEDLSAGDGEFPLVTAANALHWFRPSEAFPEICRVMGPDGALALIWNAPDRKDPIHAALEEIRHSLPIPDPMPGFAEPGEGEVWDRCFEAFTDREFPFTHRLTAAAVPDFVESWSMVANSEPGEKSAIRERARAVVGDLADDELVELPFRVSATLVRARRNTAG